MFFSSMILRLSCRSHLRLVQTPCSLMIYRGASPYTMVRKRIACCTLTSNAEVPRENESTMPVTKSLASSPLCHSNHAPAHRAWEDYCQFLWRQAAKMQHFFNLRVKDRIQWRFVSHALGDNAHQESKKSVRCSFALTNNYTCSRSGKTAVQNQLLTIPQDRFNFSGSPANGTFNRSWI